MHELASIAQSYNHVEIVLVRPELFKNNRMRRDYTQSMRLSWLEVGFDLLILKELRGKTGCEGFPEWSCFHVKKLLVYARQCIFLSTVIAKVIDEENVSLFQMGFLKQSKLQGQIIDVPATDFKVLRHRASIFASPWIKKVLMLVILCRVWKSYALPGSSKIHV